jgi:hypothetical protein
MEALMESYCPALGIDGAHLRDHARVWLADFYRALQDCGWEDIDRIEVAHIRVVSR